jgi:Holliday junction resolvase
MVDSRQKGARAEAEIKKKLRDATGLNFQRTPGSGALNETHKLKGDIYIPNEKNRFCIEVKHYKDDHLTSKILTGKDPQLILWWEQAIRQANQVDMEPILFFKKDRGKWFVAGVFDWSDKDKALYIQYDKYDFSIVTLDNFLEGHMLEKLTWIS